MTSITPNAAPFSGDILSLMYFHRLRSRQILTGRHGAPISLNRNQQLLDLSSQHSGDLGTTSLSEGLISNEAQLTPLGQSLDALSSPV